MVNTLDLSFKIIAFLETWISSHKDTLVKCFQFICQPSKFSVGVVGIVGLFIADSLRYSVGDNLNGPFAG